MLAPHGVGYGAGGGAPLVPVQPPLQGGPRDAAALHREALLAAQAVLASEQPVSKRALGQQLGIAPDAFKHLFDARGRMIIGTRAVSLVLSEDGARFAALPRTLSAADARSLDQALQLPAQPPAGGLRQACLDAGMSPVAVDYLFRRDGTLTGLLDGLTDAQRHRLQALVPGPVDGAAPPQWQPVRLATGSQERVAAYLTAQRRLASGERMSDVAAGVNLGASTLHSVFDARGNLLVAADADLRLRGADDAQRQALQALPRALREVDLKAVVQLLARQAGRPMHELQAAGARAGIPGPALAHLFDEHGLRHAQVAALPAAQVASIMGALAEPAGGQPAAVEPQQRQRSARPAQPRRAPERVEALRQAQQLLAQGSASAAAAAQVNVKPAVLSATFSADGRLLLTPSGEALLNVRDDNLRAAFEAMPRALRPTDANQLVKVLGAAAAIPGADLRAAAVQARVPAEVLAFLFDDTGLRTDRLRSLPARQAAAIAAAAGVVVPEPEEELELEPELGAPVPVARPDRRGRHASAARAGALAQAAQLLSAQATHAQAAEQTGRQEHDLRRIFDANGRLLISRDGNALLRIRDDGLRAPFEALPRALTGSDLGLLAEVLQNDLADPVADLRRAAALAGVTRHALDYLFEGSQLRDDRLATLPPEQMSALLLRGEPAPSQTTWFVRPGRLAQMRDAQQLIAGGMARHDAAAQLDLPADMVDKHFDHSGHLQLSVYARALLRAPDPELRAHFEALPRSLRHRDLKLLCRALREHAREPFPNLLDAAAYMGVGQHALDHLFEGGQLREDRLDGLPPGQSRRLRAAGAGAAPAESPSDRPVRQPRARPRGAAPGSAPAGRPHRRPRARPRNAAPAETLARAAQLLRAGASRMQAASETGLAGRSVSRSFDPEGRLWINKHGHSLLGLADAGLRGFFEALPRSLPNIDLTRLSSVLVEHAQNPFPDLSEAAAEAGVGQHALNYLFEAGEIREDRLALLPPEQLRQLLAARAGLPAPLPQGPLNAHIPTLEPASPVTLQPAATERGLSDPPVDARPPRTPRPPRPPRPDAGPASRSSTQMPGAAEIAAVLRHFREQPGLLAFAQARQRFGLTPERLLQWLARAGVSEEEARRGAIPDPAVLWQRLSPAGSQPPWANERAGESSDLDSFAASLEGLLESPAPRPGDAQATSRKRPPSAAPAGEPSRSRMRVGTPQEAAAPNPASRPRAERTGRNETLWGRLLQWGVGRLFGTPEPQVGLADPGPPTLEDLSFLDQPHLMGQPGGPVARGEVDDLGLDDLDDPSPRGPNR